MVRRVVGAAAVAAVVSVAGGQSGGLGDVVEARRLLSSVRETVLESAGERGLNAGRFAVPREQLGAYGRDGRVLETTLAMFDDALALPREVGRPTTTMALAGERGDVAGTLRALWLRLGVSAGRGIEGVVEFSDRGEDDGRASRWGVAWLDERRSDGRALQSLDALAIVLERLETPVDESDRVLAFAAELPDAVRRLIVRLLLADVRARQWADTAIDGQAVRAAVDARLRATGASPLAMAGVSDAYGAAIAAFEPSVGVGGGGREPVLYSLGLFDAVDDATLAYASLLYTRLAGEAIEEFRAWRFETGWRPQQLDGALDRGVRFVTSLGVVRINGARDDLTDIGREADLQAIANEGGRREPAGLALLLDLGGDDVCRGRVATSGLRGVTAGGTRVAGTIAAVVDLDGDDRYESDGSSPSLCAGFFGIGMLADLAGDDEYLGEESSIGRALHGVAVLVDHAGDDTYATTGPFGQAAAHGGVALVLDRAGADVFAADSHAQGFGGTVGAAALVNIGGDDRYTARRGVNMGDAYAGRSVSMAQGCGMGRRADFGDGHSLAGGFGYLVDTAGDDRYTAGALAQGVGYWWGVGALEDWAGDDEYAVDWWGLGAAVHFSVGTFVDLAGDDTYNATVENEAGGAVRGRGEAITRYLGAARDGAIAVAVDASGRDVYLARARSLGHADLGCVALFFEGGGGDRYVLETAGPASMERAPFAGDDALGGVTSYGPWDSFRDDFLTTAVFLDAGGSDAYFGGSDGMVDGGWWERSKSDRERAIGIDRGG